MMVCYKNEPKPGLKKDILSCALPHCGFSRNLSASCAHLLMNFSLSGFLLRTYKAARSLERALFLPLRRQIGKALILL